jgi:hypothetical protein
MSIIIAAIILAIGNIAFTVYNIVRYNKKAKELLNQKVDLDILQSKIKTQHTNANLLVRELNRLADNFKSTKKTMSIARPSNFDLDKNLEEAMREYDKRFYVNPIVEGEMPKDEKGNFKTGGLCFEQEIKTEEQQKDVADLIEDATCRENPLMQAAQSIGISYIVDDIQNYLQYVNQKIERLEKENAALKKSLRNKLSL